MSFIDRLKRIFGGGGASGNGAGHADMISCEEALSVIYEFLDGEVGPQDHAQIQKALTHLAAQQNEDGGFPYINPSP